MRDLAFGIFRIWAVAYGFAFALPSFITQMVFMPSVIKRAGDADRFEVAVQIATVGTLPLLFVCVLLVFARSLSRLVPASPLPEIKLDPAFITTCALIIAGIALIAAASGSLIVLINDLLHWTNFKRGDPDHFRGWMVEWQPVSQLIVGAAFLFLASRR
jgi:hypothetical protein